MANFTAKERERYATVHSGGKDKFPIKDQASASAALRLINHAKPPLSDAQKAKVRRRAQQFLSKEKVDQNRKSAG